MTNLAHLELTNHGVAAVVIVIFTSLSQVVVIKHGAIVECGTHDELITKGGVYKKLVLRQLSSMQDRAEIVNVDPSDLAPGIEDLDSDDSDTEDIPEK